jgi:hypothetical protein
MNTDELEERIHHSADPDGGPEKVKSDAAVEASSSVL